MKFWPESLSSWIQRSEDQIRDYFSPVLKYLLETKVPGNGQNLHIDSLTHGVRVIMAGKANGSSRSCHSLPKLINQSRIASPDISAMPKTWNMWKWWLLTHLYFTCQFSAKIGWILENDCELLWTLSGSDSNCSCFIRCGSGSQRPQGIFLKSIKTAPGLFYTVIDLRNVFSPKQSTKTIKSHLLLSGRDKRTSSQFYFRVLSLTSSLS